MIAVPLTVDHKPNQSTERERLQRLGVPVQFNRVRDQLAMSRSFGDFQLKNMGG